MTDRAAARPQPPYSVLPALLKRYEHVGRKHAYAADDRAAHARWRRATLKALKQIIGFDTFASCPLKPRITEEKQLDGYRRQRVEFKTEPGVVMPLYVLIPDRATGRTPAVTCPHGHDGGGKLAVAGCREIAEVAERIDRYRYDYGVQYARAGLISFCPDARGFGERRERSALAGSILSSSCAAINQMGYPLGQTVTGMWAWDLCRLVDYIQTRPDCDPTRIGCAGLSGGGLQTLWATALDERIRAAVVSGYFYGYKESLLEGYQNCSCNFVPHLYEHVDMGDIAALIAPRPLLVETGTRDSLNGRSGMKNVQSQLRIARKAYRVLGAPNNLVHDVFDDGHRWNGELAVPWLKGQLAGKPE
jgi:dienelactone hydrolase